MVKKFFPRMVKYIARKRDKINTSLMLRIHNKKRVVIIFSSTGKKLYNHFHHLLVLTMKVDRSILFINLRNYLFTVFFLFRTLWESTLYLPI